MAHSSVPSGGALPAYRTAFGLSFNGWLTPEQFHGSPSSGTPELCAEPGDGPWMKGPIQRDFRSQPAPRQSRPDEATDGRAARAGVRQVTRKQSELRANLSGLPRGRTTVRIPHRQASSTPYRGAPERRLGAPEGTLRWIRARRRARERSARSPPLRGGLAPPRAARRRGRRSHSRDHARPGPARPASNSGCRRSAIPRAWQRHPAVPMGQTVHSARPRRRRGRADAW
jgi:hypothetical protein